MKMVVVEDVPNINGRHDVKSMIEEFANGDALCVKLEFKEREYKNACSLYASVYKAVKKNGYKIKVYTRNGDVYLKKVV